MNIICNYTRSVCCMQCGTWLSITRPYRQLVSWPDNSRSSSCQTSRARAPCRVDPHDSHSALRRELTFSSSPLHDTRLCAVTLHFSSRRSSVYVLTKYSPLLSLSFQSIRCTKTLIRPSVSLFVCLQRLANFKLSNRICLNIYLTIWFLKSNKN